MAIRIQQADFDLTTEIANLRQGDFAAASLYLARASVPQNRTPTALIDPPMDEDEFAALRASAPGRA